MRFYFKAIKGYMAAIFFPDEDEMEYDAPYGFKSNFVKRYFYYTMEEYMMVNPKTGRYEHKPMPYPFCIPGKIGWRLLYIWQVKIVKTHM